MVLAVQFFRAAGDSRRKQITASKGGKGGEWKTACSTGAQEIIHGIDQSSPIHCEIDPCEHNGTGFSHGRARAPEKMYRPLSEDKTASTICM